MVREARYRAELFRNLDKHLRRLVEAVKSMAQRPRYTCSAALLRGGLFSPAISMCWSSLV
ncbi:MAG: hypothetical protein QXW41_06525 [Fervidicoccaceae archaeon]